MRVGYIYSRICWLGYSIALHEVVASSAVCKVVISESCNSP